MKQGSLVLLLLLPLLLPAQQPSIREAVRQFAEKENLRRASVGIRVVDVVSGEVLAAHNPDLLLEPASTMKLMTTASALLLLGPDYRFTTQLLYTGTLSRDGVLDGDIIILGSGDPTLASPQMEGVTGRAELLQRWRLAIQQAGIRSIRGRVVGDGSAWATEGTGRSWPWSDIGNYYGAGVYGLNWYENTYYLQFRQGSQVGLQPRIMSVQPPVPGLVFYNEVRTAAKGTGDNAYIFGAPYSYDRYVRGTLPAGTGTFMIKGSVPDPPLWVAQQLQAELEVVGILCSRPPASARQLTDWPERIEGRLLDRIESPALSQIAERTNFRSVNLYAEALFRALAGPLNAVNEPHMIDDALRRYWSNRGLPAEAWRFDDGSGLSTRNFITATQMTELLRRRAGDRAFRASIPVAGRSGNMQRLLKGTSAEGRLQAKSGSIDAVRAYAGYARTGEGREVAFAILVNNYTGSGSQVRQQQLALMQRLCY